jgi:PAS domain S-box-containing protein
MAEQNDLLAIFDGIDEPVYVADPATHDVLFVNRVLESLFGPPGGRKCYEYLQHRSAPCPFCTNDRILGEYLGRSYVWEFQNEANRRWYKCIDKAIPWPDGRLVRYEMAIDITDFKRAEDEARESAQQLRSMSDNLPRGLVYQIDSGVDGKERRFTYVSGGVEELHELSAAEAMADPTRIYGQVHEQDRSLVREREEDALRAMRPLSVEVRVVLPSGRTGWRLFNSAPRRLQNGHLVWDGVEIDITPRKRSEEERERLLQQLSQAQKMESVGRLAGGIAHDFNNMLAVIIGYAELALDRIPASDPTSEDLSKIRAVAERSADLTRQLLAFARKQTAAPRVLDLSRTVDGMLQLLRRLIGEDVELAWHPDAGAGLTRIDLSQLNQILVNLCLNARDAIAETGRITIETGRGAFDAAYCAAHAGYVPGEYVLLAVSDDGCGMDAETRAHVFEPFFTTKEPGKGTGLGLSTVYGIVRQNDGFIDVYSEPERGTTFKVFLPRCAAEHDPKPGDEAGDTGVQGGGETILLVEDEAMLRDVARKMLELAGYRVIAAAAPGEALRLAREHAGGIHLLLTDVIMPEMSGRDLAERIVGLHPGVRRLFMSGYTANVVAQHGVMDEGVHFLQKPFSMNDLTAKVREALAGRS